MAGIDVERDELQLKNKLTRVGAAAGEVKNEAKLSLNWVLAGALAELGKKKAISRNCSAGIKFGLRNGIKCAGLSGKVGRRSIP